MSGARATLMAIWLALFAGVPAPSFADAQDVVVEDAWARASVGTRRPGAAYMTLRNTGPDPVTLTGLETPIAMMPGLHETRTDANNISSMAPAGDITILPGESVSLEPGGLHVMLMRLQGTMAEGDTFALTLIFADGAKVTVDVPILGVAARGPEG